ncbi:hypothetical protein CRP01_28745 [Flavilitoribacter nigricans DSM 23189 = NBRC 102662]|uniref:Tetratricopeptide repeat protein n=2 Tax=Flavilitoribacter TaxID=2762562 RepID=A0A2D0N3H4_FLAN2|nr:hypothetical protein CRP01_28745 [Flavilitoribacter nigricans DSM 23189 = NBRC 102662]
MPKEHKLRKNRKVFARRKAQVEFKRRTAGGSGQGADTPVRRDTPRWSRDRKSPVWHYLLMIFILGTVGVLTWSVFRGYWTFSGEREKLALENEAYRRHQLERQKQEAVALAIDSGWDALSHREYTVAEEEFAQALRLFPEHPDARRGLVWSRVLICETTAQDCRQALELLNAYLADNPDAELSIYQSRLQGRGQK